MDVNPHIIIRRCVICTVLCGRWPFLIRGAWPMERPDSQPLYSAADAMALRLASGHFGIFCRRLIGGKMRNIQMGRR